MRIVGKAAPEPADLERAHDDGFDAVELYLTTDHLDRYDESVAALDDAALDVVAVHTPHVPPERSQYIDQAVELAAVYDALLVFHSSRFPPLAIDYGEQLDYDCIAYENDYGFPHRVIKNLILDREKQLVLDTAHLFIASDSFWTDMEILVDYATHIHLCDSTALHDGLRFGEGAIDMARLIRVIEQSSFNGNVVLEVMPEHQHEAKVFVEQHLI